MSRRNKWTIICLAATLILAAPAPGQPPSAPDKPENRIIRFYQTYISAADGARCPMYPSCSGYAALALKKHGAVMGWIMTCDRLLRCGRSESHLAPEILIQCRPRIYDPVSANDFWWFIPPSDGMKKCSNNN